MAEISVTINGIKCVAKENETILNIARANGIFIPALCYVSCCSPTLACRLCMADVDGKRVYTCNAKAKDGQIIETNTEEIEKERHAIMQVYAVNHPLECGVCDKSGECELQNYMLDAKVTKQEFYIDHTNSQIKNWGITRYDSTLCIMCEKCVTVCKDMIGEAALKTVPRGEELAVPKEYKESMPKDAFAVWNKMQKSIIDKNRDEDGHFLPCSDCGECSAVCPTGAMSAIDFHYKSNAWELKKIPASNPHSSDCSLIYYEVKHASVSDPSAKIYRVSGDKDFGPLNRAARFGYDFENRVAAKDKNAFDKVLNFIKTEANTILFSGYITNEEAYILQKMKEKLGLKLVNDQAFALKRFLDAMSKCSGNSLYKGSLEGIRKSDLIISMGSVLRYESPNTAYALNNALKINKASAIYAHHLYDKVLQNYSKNLLQLTIKPFSEEALLLLLFEMLMPEEKINKNIKTSLNSLLVFVCDEKCASENDVRSFSELWNIIGISDDVSQKIKEMIAGKEKISFIVGEDLLLHPQWENIAHLLGTLERETNVEALVIPPETNSLGVALICDLDKYEEGEVFGYFREGKIDISALFGDATLDMPALNQQEGTFVNIDKRLVPTNAALDYNGYELNDIANALGIESEFAIDYTSKLPAAKGFENIDFDSLENYYDNSGKDCRGYLLTNIPAKISKKPKGYSDIYSGKDLIYRLNPHSQFNPFVNVAKHTRKHLPKLYVTDKFAASKDLKEGDDVQITSKTGIILALRVEVDKSFDGNAAYIPTFHDKVYSFPFFDEFRFAQKFVQFTHIQRVGK